jgi:predicted lipoprotein with Yx(FWY)xxD motif
MNHIAKSWKVLLVTAALTLPSLAFAAEPAMMKGGMMVDQKGMTLYTFDKDKDGKSMCMGECAKNWPPMMAPMDAKPMGEWKPMKRDDGTMQWTYDGKPMYTYKMDSKPGDMKGDGMMKMWHVIGEHK